MNTAPLGLRAAMFIGIALATYGTGAGVVRAQAVKNIYVPGTTELLDVGSPPRKVCVIGYSVPKTFSIDTFNFVVPTYYLTSTGWTPITTQRTNDPITALQVGPGFISQFQSRPQSSTPEPNSAGYLNSGRIAFFVVDTSSIKCSDITYTWVDPPNGIVSETSKPYDNELKTFFTNASGSTKLKVMGDQAGSCVPACPWRVEKTTSCPVFLNHPADDALQFMSSAPFKIILCNPLNQTVALGAQLPPPLAKKPL